jgi:hypothetical protein
MPKYILFGFVSARIAPLDKYKTKTKDNKKNSNKILVDQFTLNRLHMPNKMAQILEV